LSEMDNDRILGKTGIRIPSLGIGAWAWGDRFFWSYGRGYGDEDIKAAFLTSLEAGITFVDTAEVYGLGRSERYIGNFLIESKTPVVIATKFFPFPWRFSKGSLLRALRNSLQRLKLDKVDLYQIHNPASLVPIETWAEALVEAVQLGLARAVGVSNYTVEQMKRAYHDLEKHGIPLASNQVIYNLINRQVEFDGLLKTCQEMGISLIAYSPLAQGILTGKYSPDNPLPGIRGQRYSRSLLERAQPLIRLMREVGDDHQGKTPAQVALNWTICKGTVPIPGAKNARQAQENAGAMGWSLSEAEVIALDEMSARLT
jgi:aryl-alcohol dehydrogenase-like predicted oxidoreductase